MIKSVLRSTGAVFHGAVARSPLAHGYLEAVGSLCRIAPGQSLVRLRNSAERGGFDQSISLRPRQVEVGGLPLKLVPHLGEFDVEVLFRKQLSYEEEVFSFLRPRMAQYDWALDIGANVGVYTCWFAKQVERVVAVEPSHEPFRRLQENLSVNSATNVIGIHAAVNTHSGLAEFFAPQRALTNGSFRREFAGRFSEQLDNLWVPCLRGEDLRELLPNGRGLVKIDVETAEPLVLQSLAGLLQEQRPDVLLEVLPEVSLEIEAAPALRGYRRIAIEPTSRDAFYEPM